MCDHEEQNALRVVTSAIRNCEKVQPKFEQGTPQHTLLQNRLRALYLAKSLLAGEGAGAYSKGDLEQSLPPIASILHKCSTAQRKFSADNPYYLRLEKMIRAMVVVERLIRGEIAKGGGQDQS